ncbi:SH3-like domain-containing protein [Litorimonas haliclonae]
MGNFHFSRPFLAGLISVFLIAGSAAAQLSTSSADIPMALPSPAETPARRIVVNPVPEAPSEGFFRKAAHQTPSGFEVPRYVSLKFGKVNGRTGPSRNHSIAWQYRRRDLPLIVVAETEMWRKVRDINGDEAWVRKPALSGERFVMTIGEALVLSKPDPNARPIARGETGALFKLETCNEDGWCYVKSRNGLKGWISDRQLWGAQTL